MKLEDMTMTQLTDLHNQHADQPVKRFATKGKAVERTRAVLPKEETVKKARGAHVEAKGFAPVACKEGTKQAALVDALHAGATMEELLAVTGWNTRGSVQAGFSWDMKNKGYGVRSEGDKYYLVVPEGYSVPAHTPKKGK